MILFCMHESAHTIIIKCQIVKLKIVFMLLNNRNLLNISFFNSYLKRSFIRFVFFSKNLQHLSIIKSVMCPRKCSLHISVNNTKLSDFNIELVVQILHSEMFPNYMNFSGT